MNLTTVSPEAFSTAMTGRRTGAAVQNDIKENTGVHIGNGVVLTTSWFFSEEKVQIRSSVAVAVM